MHANRDSLDSMTERPTHAPVLNPQATASAHAGGCPQDMPISETPVSQQDTPEEEIKTISRGDRNKFCWYVMRSSYCREMKAMNLLEDDGFQCYVPTHQVRTVKNGQVEQHTTALIHNLVFVHSTRNILDPWKKLHEGDAALRYTIDKSTSRPMTITDKAMQDFIRVTRESDEGLLYLDNPEIVLTHGQKVEIILGPFKGVQGYVLRIRKDRRVVVTLGGLVSAALATMPREHFKLIVSNSKA